MAQVFATSFHPDWHLGAMLAERHYSDFWCEACRDTGDAMEVTSACSSGGDAWRSQEFRPPRRPAVNVAQSAETDWRFDHLTLHTEDLSRTGVRSRSLISLRYGRDQKHECSEWPSAHRSTIHSFEQGRGCALASSHSCFCRSTSRCASIRGRRVVGKRWKSAWT